MTTFTRLSILTILLSIFLVGCSTGPMETIESTSPEGDRSVKITGEVKAPMDPITVTVTLSVPGGDKTFTFNHQANSLTKDNCIVKWETNETGTITLKYDDEGQQVIDMKLSDDQVVAVKRFSLEDINVIQ